MHKKLEDFSPTDCLESIKNSFQIFYQSETPILETFIKSHHNFISNNFNLNIFKLKSTVNIIGKKPDKFPFNIENKLYIILNELQDKMGIKQETITHHDITVKQPGFLNLILGFSTSIEISDKLSTYLGKIRYKALEYLQKDGLIYVPGKKSFFYKQKRVPYDAQESIHVAKKLKEQNNYSQENIIYQFLTRWEEQNILKEVKLHEFMNFLFGALLIRYGIKSVSNWLFLAPGGTIFLGTKQIWPLKRPLTSKKTEELFFNLLAHSYFEKEFALQSPDQMYHDISSQITIKGHEDLSHKEREKIKKAAFKRQTQEYLAQLQQERFKDISSILKHPRITQSILIPLPTSIGTNIIQEAVYQEIVPDLYLTESYTSQLQATLPGLSLSSGIAHLHAWYLQTQHMDTHSKFTLESIKKIKKMKSSIMGLYNKYLNRTFE